MENKDGSGLRFNSDKPRMDLLPWDALTALAHHYRIGALKYEDRNWEKGLKWNEGCAASLLRHAGEWGLGEDFQVETIQGQDYKLYHDVAMAWNSLALVTFRLRGLGVDDRPKIKENPQFPEGSLIFTVP